MTFATCMWDLFLSFPRHLPSNIHPHSSSIFLYHSFASHPLNMFSFVFSLGALALLDISSLAATQKGHGHSGRGSPKWVVHNHTGQLPQCTEENIDVRRNFDSMALEARKAYTDAVLSLTDRPSQLDSVAYPATTTASLITPSSTSTTPRSLISSATFSHDTVASSTSMRKTCTISADTKVPSHTETGPPLPPT